MSHHFKLITEDELQGTVLALFRANGWLASHFHDSRKQVRGNGGEYRLVGDRDASGFPDTVATHPGLQEVLFMELKREGLWPTLEQVSWLDCLPGHKAFLIWPSDLDWLELKAMGVAGHLRESIPACLCWWCSGRREEYIEASHATRTARGRRGRQSPQMQAAIEQAQAVNRALRPEK